jgi:rhodanese-related sulfurtransferase
MTSSNIAGKHDVSPAAGYAGDVVPATAWKILTRNKDAVLIDVRTRAEWNYVGLPELASIGKKPALLEWQVFPSMQQNPSSCRRWGTPSRTRIAPLLFLCRSGARSAAAARAMTAAGIQYVFQRGRGVSRGRLTRRGTRGSAAGWKAAGLPWRQT